MALTNLMNLPQPFVDAATSDYKPKPKRYSVTRVLGGTCEAVLLKRHNDELGGDVADMVWMLFGSAVHKILEESKETDEQLKENWISVPVGEYELSGIFDLYDDSTGTVTDYKTCSVWKIKFGDYEDWRRQTLLYCWMLRRLGFAARRGEIVALIKDHSKRDARLKASEGYPPHPVFKIGWDFAEGDFEWAERYVEEWFARVAREETLGDDMLEPCTPEQRWHRDDKWAVRRGTTKKALRVLGSPEEAERWLEAHRESYKGSKLWVEHRRGEDTKCEGYCDVACWCPYGKGVSEGEGSAR